MTIVVTNIKNISLSFKSNPFISIIILNIESSIVYIIKANFLCCLFLHIIYLIISSATTTIASNKTNLKKG